VTEFYLAQLCNPTPLDNQQPFQELRYSRADALVLIFHVRRFQKQQRFALNAQGPKQISENTATLYPLSELTQGALDKLCQIQYFLVQHWEFRMICQPLLVI
jgi:hypothetical protein